MTITLTDMGVGWEITLDPRDIAEVYLIPDRAIITNADGLFFFEMSRAEYDCLKGALCDVAI